MSAIRIDAGMWIVLPGHWFSHTCERAKSLDEVVGVVSDDGDLASYPSHPLLVYQRPAAVRAPV